jgi:hypothetical protein
MIAINKMGRMTASDWLAGTMICATGNVGQNNADLCEARHTTSN